MAFTFYHNVLPAGTGAAIADGAARKASFARRIELARLQIERQRADLAEADQVLRAGDAEWRRRFQAEQAAREQAAAAAAAARREYEFGAAQALKREDMDRRGREAYGRLELEAAKTAAGLAKDARTEEARARAEAFALAKAGFRQVEPGAEPRGERVRGPGGSVWEKDAAAEGAKYTPYQQQRLRNLNREIEDLQRRREAEIKEAEAVGKALADLQPLLGTFPKDPQKLQPHQRATVAREQQMRQRLEALTGRDDWDRRIEEKRRAIDAITGTRRAGEDGQAAEVEAGDLAARAAAMPLSPKGREALQWAEEKLRTGTPAERAQALAVLRRLAAR